MYVKHDAPGVGGHKAKVNAILKYLNKGRMHTKYYIYEQRKLHRSEVKEKSRLMDTYNKKDLNHMPISYNHMVDGQKKLKTSESKKCHGSVTS